MIGPDPGFSLADLAVQIQVCSVENGIEKLQHLRIDALADNRHMGLDSGTSWAARPSCIGSHEARLRRHQKKDDWPKP